MVDASSIILAGGQSRRLGFDKTALRVDGQTMLERTVGLMAALCRGDVVVVTAAASERSLAGARLVADLYPGKGVLAGIYTGLSAGTAAYSLVVAADMPFLSAGLLSYLLSLAPQHDVVVPVLNGYAEPLHAVYSRACLQPIEQQLKGDKAPRIISFFADVDVRRVAEADLLPHDPQLLSFFNINTPEDLQRAQAIGRERGIKIG